ncbi:MAG: MaoC family dehydratase [Hyphomicrobiales bacterium]|nr:MaoC family dehydratase [Hyphomicrobiales bacterium]
MPWFDELVVGERWDLGAHVFEREEILRFARVFDPQPFHLDEEAAKASLFGRLSASGWHTAAVCMRLIVETSVRLYGPPAAGGARIGVSPGFSDMRWTKPVLVGDEIAYSSEIVAKRETSRPGWGLVSHRNVGVNARGETAISFGSSVFWSRRRA